MEKLIVDAEGKITIPARILAERGLRPGDELTLVEADEGLLIYQHGLDPLTTRWWNGLSENERRQAQAEAKRYESLSEAERDRIWGDPFHSGSSVIWHHNILIAPSIWRAMNEPEDEL